MSARTISLAMHARNYGVEERGGLWTTCLDH